MENSVVLAAVTALEAQSATVLTRFQSRKRHTGKPSILECHFALFNTKSSEQT